ncbi:MAG TPA: peptidoglycan-binding domain-containing protein [Conexibacter sp.]
MAAALFVTTSAFGASLGRRTLTEGMTGQDVRVLQDFLTRAGFKTPVAGEFGPVTLTNVKAFEKQQSMPTDGVVDADVIAKLRSIADPSSATTTTSTSTTTTPSATPTTSRTTTTTRGGHRHLGDRVLRKGATGQDVRVLQDYLERAGFTSGIDGEFGPTTLRMVKKFQQAQELRITGIVDTTTVSALRRVGDVAATNTAGGADFDMSTVQAPVGRAKLLSNGLAVAPSDAPQEVKDVIDAGNQIATMPYIYGGGHGSWRDRGYDCSGSVSFALHGGGMLDSSMPSGGFEGWGQSGRGQWITIYANGGHMYMTVAGLRFDTSGADPSRWQSDMRDNSGFVVRHPTGF